MWSFRHIFLWKTCNYLQENVYFIPQAPRRICHVRFRSERFYYSQAQDWYEPGGTYWNIEQGEPHWDPDLQREPLMNYIDGKAVPQVKEILEIYGTLDILWWDTPSGMTEEAARALGEVADRYPKMLQNNTGTKSSPAGLKGVNC